MIELKAISELLDKEFFIPSYQRGYRWESKQVEDLLEDILEFANKKKVEKEFYCLQPVVVKRDEDGKYRVIDGQQRLTSIYIILKYFENLLEEDYFIEDIYNISYETRSDSKFFLESIKSVKDYNRENIDFYYMSNSYLVIKEWFKKNIKKKKITKRKFLEVLIDLDIKTETIENQDKKVDYANNIRVIWYEIKDENEIDVFTRLNSGKIPLTPAELIKALFLLEKKEENEKLLLASQWDEIEYKLQEPNFFAFINGDEYKKATKIEFIFDLIAKKREVKIDNLRKDDELRTFYIFNELISNSDNDLWDEVKTYFRVFEELYNDNKYYHLVGFLVNSGIKIQDIVDDFQKNRKDKFLEKLKYTISNEISFGNKQFKELNYNEDYKEVSNILFLFNVLATLESNYSKYPFDRHKSEKWSLEHIHAQNSKDMEEDDKKNLLKSQKDYIKDNKVKEEIENIDNIDEALRQISSHFGELNLHTIDNLALLTRDDNSAINNSIFPDKRKKIKKLDREGSFIPLGTKNIFLKYYSDDVKETIVWNKEDREAYLEALKETLSEYIGEEK